MIDAILTALYTIIVFPLFQIIETVFVLCDRIFDNHGIAIAGVSFAVTFLCLPLYVVAEKWQKTEWETFKKLKPKIDRIKAVFRGDEQYFILTAYYRQNGYHPLYALRNSFGILIQIPFFIAAYNYLSHLELLHGARFFFIRDLGSPDALISAGAWKINVLPVLMTAINAAAGTIYTKGLALRDKIQVYGIAFVFLFLLYNSPAGLVLYWTMNNVLSLAKNIFYKIEKPVKKLYILVCVFLTLFIAYLLFVNDKAFHRRLILCAVSGIFYLIPLLVKFVVFAEKKFLSGLENNGRLRHALFMTACAALVLLTGLCIPASTIASSPAEFSFIDSRSSPLIFILWSFGKSLGFFCFWPACVYFLFGKKIQAILAFLFSVLFFSALGNAFIFMGNYGVITNMFAFNSTASVSPSFLSTVSNILFLCFLFLFLLFLSYKKFTRAVHAGTGIVLLSLSVFGAVNLFQIQDAYRQLASRPDARKTVHSTKPIFSFSKENPNVIVFMADCAINGFVKPIFAEHPELEQIYDGFTLYPNTVSFALHTLMGAPPIWGGYEYTPKAMNGRDSVTLREKNNEALLLLPRLFSDAGYRVTVTDPSWANHEWIPDTGIYDGYDNINAMNTKGKYSHIWYRDNSFGSEQITGDRIIRNIFWFSALRIAPVNLRSIIYNNGWYWSAEDLGDSITDLIDSYAVLDFLPELTDYNSETSAAMLISNELTHEPHFLQAPDYRPVGRVTDRGDGGFSDNPYYHVNNAFYLKFGEWLESLKTGGVYDNTRIVIVSDHGAGIDARLGGGDISIPGERREGYNPVLLVKDFYAHGALKTDMEFMTSADVPILVTRGIVRNPVNPFTRNPLTDDAKKDGIWIAASHLPLARQHGKFKFKINDDQWIYVKNNIFDADNWKKSR